MSIGERIKMIRKESGLKQIDFAKRVLVTSSYISKVESNKEIPSDIFVKLIALEFNVSYEWLKDGTGNMNLDKKRHDYFERNSNFDQHTMNTYKELEELIKSIHLQTNENNTFRIMCISDICDNITKMINFKMQGAQKDLYIGLLADYIGSIEELTERLMSFRDEVDYAEKSDFCISSFMKEVEKIFDDMKDLIKKFQ